MPKKTTFIVYGYIERHYRIEVEAESYDEAERKGYDMLNDLEPAELYGEEDGTQIVMGDVECEDSEWDEDSEEE